MVRSEGVVGDEVGSVRRDDEVVHDVFQRPFVGEHANRRSGAVELGGDGYELFDGVPGWVDHVDVPTGILENRLEDIVNLMVE